jgi:imidazolonepropionase-like amidohydrolase
MNLGSLNKSFLPFRILGTLLHTVRNPWGRELQRERGVQEMIMKTIFAILFVSLFSVADLAGQGSKQVAHQAASRIWISDVTILSPERLDHIGTGSVLIEDGRIVRVERKQGAKKPAGVTVVDGKGQFLVPGLIDSHVHLASVPGMGFDQISSNAEMVRSYYKQMPRSYLYYGYTTVVDLGVMVDHQVLKDFRESPEHPDLYDCGEALVFANGYPMSYASPEVRFELFSNFIYDPEQASSIPPEYKPEAHTPAADVARVKGAGGICVKTFYERGFGPAKNLPVMGEDVLAEIRKEATRDGLVLMMHANSYEAQKFAVDGGVDVIAHGMWNWGDLDKEKGLPDEIRQVLDRIVEKKIGYQPTVQVLEGERVYFEPDYLGAAGIRRVVPKAMLAWFSTAEGKGFKKGLVDDDTPDAVIAQGYEKGPIRRDQQVVAYLAGRNANFLFGTDTPSGPTYGNLPGLNGYLEMRQLQKAGMSLTQIFRAATSSNAREFKLDSQLGTIERGKIANLLLLKQSPLESVDAYDSITTVWVHGTAIARDSLAVDSVK